MTSDPIPNTEDASPPLEGDRRVTPIVVPRRAAYAAGVAAVLLVLFVLWTVPSVVTIAIGGGALALLLSYPVRILARYMPRKIAVLVTVLGACVIVGVTFYIAIPPIASQVTDFVEDLPDIADDAEQRLRDTAQRLEDDGLLPGDADQLIGDIEADLTERLKSSIEPILTGLLGRITGILGIFITIFGIIFVGITLLLDADRLRRNITGAFPRRYHDDLDQLWNDLGTSLSRYLGGLIFVAVAQGALVAVGLLIIGVPYALVLGVWVAFTSIIPYFGAWLGGIPAIILALLDSPLTAVWTALLYLGVNILEGNFLTPRVQGEAVRVHPVIVLLTVVGAGGLFGVMGIILAVPLLAIGRVLFDFFRARIRLQDSGGAPPVA